MSLEVHVLLSVGVLTEVTWRDLGPACSVVKNPLLSSTVSQNYFTHPDFSKPLELVVHFEVHGGGGQLGGFGWMVHHLDVHLDRSSCAVLALHKDVLGCAYSQQVRSRQHLTAKQREEDHPEAASCSDLFYKPYSLCG